MFFLATHLGILLMTLFFAVLGMPLAELLPWKVRPAARAYLTPALGWAVAILLVTPWGWLGSGFAQAGVRLAALAVFGCALLWVVCWRPRALRPIPRLLGLSAVCALPFTLQLLFCEAYNPFNDAFTYIVQSQWLQHHHMAGILVPRVDQPALSQIRFTQVSGTRVSAQFVFGFAQAILGIKWAHDAYPIAMCAAGAAGCLTVAFAAQAGLRSPSRWFPALAACFCGLSSNGYAFGALNGFYPQTVGLACGFAALWMFGLTLARKSEPAWNRREILSCLPVAVAASASLYAYSEFFPLLVIGMGGGSAVAFVLAGKGQIHRPAARVIALLALTLVFTCPELPRAARAIISQSHSVVGGPVLWSPWDFAMHCAGLRSGVLEGENWLGNSVIISGALAILMTAGAAAQAARCGLGQARVIALSPILMYLALAVLLFIKFRYFTVSPFPSGVGQSWNQFKLAGWSGLGFIGLLGSLSNAGGANRGALRLCAGLVWCLAILAASQTALAAARPRGETFEAAVANRQSPMDGVFQFRAEVNRIVPAGAPLHLDLDKRNLKLTQFLAYAWMDRPVLADWSQDDYIHNNMPRVPSSAEIQAPDWVVTDDAERSSLDFTALGALKLRHATDFAVKIASVDGAFDREQSGPDSWRWVERAAVFHVHSEWRRSPANPVPIHVKFGLSVITKEPATIEVTAQNGQVLERSSSAPGSGLILYDLSEPDAAKLGENWSIRFAARGEALALGPNDPRKAAFMIRDLTVSTGPSLPAPGCP